MKRLFFSLSFFAASICAIAGNGDKYRVNDASVDQMFAQSQDVSSLLVDEMSLVGLNQPSAVQGASGAQTVGGFLLRNVLCGSIALHRKYMGSDIGKLWWKYLCIPVAGGLASCGDFWFVVIKGNKALSKYKGSDKWFVWM